MIEIMIIIVVLVAHKDPKGFKKSSYKRRNGSNLQSVGTVK